MIDPSEAADPVAAVLDLVVHDRRSPYALGRVLARCRMSVEDDDVLVVVANNAFARIYLRDEAQTKALESAAQIVLGAFARVEVR